MDPAMWGAWCVNNGLMVPDPLGWSGGQWGASQSCGDPTTGSGEETRLCLQTRLWLSLSSLREGPQTCWEGAWRTNLEALPWGAPVLPGQGDQCHPWAERRCTWFKDHQDPSWLCPQGSDVVPQAAHPTTVPQKIG